MPTLPPPFPVFPPAPLRSQDGDTYSVLAEAMMTRLEELPGDMDSHAAALGALVGEAEDLIAITDAVTPESRGAVGDGVTNDRVAFRDATLQSDRVVCGKAQYYLTAIPGDETPRWINSGQQPNLMLPATMKLFDGRGATLKLTAGGRGIYLAAHQANVPGEVQSELGADVAAGDTTLTLAAGQGVNWVAGDEYVWMFGSYANDFPETPNWGFGKVISVAGDVLTVSPPAPQAFAIASVATQSFTDEYGTAGRRNKRIRKRQVPRDVMFRATNIVGASVANTEYTLYLNSVQNVVVDRWSGTSTNSGFGCQFSENVTYESPRVFNVKDAGGGSGKAFDFAEVRNVTINNMHVRSYPKVVAGEAGCTITVNGGKFENFGNPATGASYGSAAIVFQAIRNGVIVQNGLYTINGHGGFNLYAYSDGTPANDGGFIQRGTILVNAPAEAYSLPLGKFYGVYGQTIAGVREEWDFSRPRVWNRPVLLKNGMYHYFNGPPGPLARLRVFAPHGVTFGAGNQVELVYLARNGTNVLDLTGKMQAGKWVEIELSGGTNAGSQWSLRNQQVQILVVTAAGTTLNPESDPLVFEAELGRPIIDADMGDRYETWSSSTDVAYSAGQFDREALFAAYDLANIAAGATLQVDFTIPDMAAGDPVVGVYIKTGLTGLIVESAEGLAGAARVVFKNPTGAAIDKAASDIVISWRKPLLAA